MRFHFPLKPELNFDLIPEDPPEVIYIAITVEDGTLTILQFITKQQRLVGLGVNELGWEREPTDEAIEEEIAKSRIPAVSWRIIQLEDLPPDRSQRNLWRDTGDKIIIDPSLGESK